MIKQLRNTTLIFVVAGLLIPGLAAAHVVVTPDQVGIGDTQIFTVSVPNEKTSAVTQVKLLLPSGLEEVAPIVKDGWTTTTTKQHDEVTALTWSQGTVPVGFDDNFSFRAQVPSRTTTLTWKAYQTYADGTTVAWDQAPTGRANDDDDGESTGPYSVTTVINDLTAPKPSSSNNILSLAIAVVALIIALAALLRTNAIKRE